MMEDVIFSTFIILHSADRPQHPNQLWYSNVLIELFQTEVSSFLLNNTFVDTFWSYCNLFKKNFDTCNLQKFQPKLIRYILLSL
jgi:hypothetical protein